MLRLRPVALTVATSLCCLLTVLVTAPAIAGHSALRPRAGAGVQAAATGLTVQGSSLALDGRRVRLSGVNGYSLTTFWPVNWGCGTQVDDIDAALASVGRGALVRTWAFQALGYDNKRAQALDFTGIDRVVQAAERRGVLLELVLSDQAGTCDDGHWHDRAWYEGGYRSVHPDDGRGLTPVSYERWVELVVQRYASSRAVAIWSPVNEPEAANCRDGLSGGSCYGNSSCPPDAAAVLRRFFDRIGGLIHRLDPGSIVASGVIGGGQCGLAGGGYSEVHGSSGIDVATFHDYGAERQALPPELAERLRQAERLGMPLLVDEAGIGASDDPADRCASRRERAGMLRAKMRAAYAAGADGYLPWWLDPGKPGGCSHALGSGDPALTVLRVATARDRLAPVRLAPVERPAPPLVPLMRWRPGQRLR